MKDLKKVFRSIETSLRRSRWFDDGWEIYNRGTYLQLYKDNWSNQGQGGVHFETFIEDNQIRAKEFPIALHAEEDCPNQTEFISNFIEMERDRIQSWKGYKVVGAGYVLCERRLPLNLKSLEQRVLEELNRLRQLEASIDAALEEVSR